MKRKKKMEKKNGQPKKSDNKHEEEEEWMRKGWRIDDEENKRISCPLLSFFCFSLEVICFFSWHNNFWNFFVETGHAEQEMRRGESEVRSDKMKRVERWMVVMMMIERRRHVLFIIKQSKREKKRGARIQSLISLLILIQFMKRETMMMTRDEEEKWTRTDSLLSLHPPFIFSEKESQFEVNWSSR